MNPTETDCYFEQIDKTLFKINNFDTIQMYQVYIKHEPKRSVIIRRYGVLNGKLQHSSVEISEGKNLGKSNETSIKNQAIAEAKAITKKERDSGYVSFGKTNEDFGVKDQYFTPFETEDGLPSVPKIKQDYYNALYKALIPFKAKGRSGVVLPMLAQDPFKGGKEIYDLNSKTVKRELKKRIEFPVAVQCKYDGARCIVDMRDPNNITLTSREGKDWTKIHHRIVKNLENAFREGKLKNVMYDCELYSDASFQDTISLIKAPDNHPLFADSLYLVCYDVVDTEKSFRGRFITEIHNVYIKNLTLSENITVANINGNYNCAIYNYLPFFRIALTYTCVRLSDIKMLHDQFVDAGYEGAMIRTLEGGYEPDKRSKTLLKYKVFSCDEFEIVDVVKKKKEVVFKCIIPSKNVLEKDHLYFNCTPPGKKENILDAEQDPSSYIGKLLTIKYFGLTKDGLPRFPKAHAIRDYESDED